MKFRILQNLNNEFKVQAKVSFLSKWADLERPSWMVTHEEAQAHNEKILQEYNKAVNLGRPVSRPKFQKDFTHFPATKIFPTRDEAAAFLKQTREEYRSKQRAKVWSQVWP